MTRLMTDGTFALSLAGHLRLLGHTARWQVLPRALI